MTTLVERIDLEIEKRSLLKHPFYKAWSEGKLDLAELRGYSMEYFQLVKMVPSLVENVRSKTNDSSLHSEISQSLKEEKEHIAPWVEFAKSLGVPEKSLQDYAGDASAKEAVSQLAMLSKLSFEEGVAAMYAYEKELPKISRSKIDGLEKFYRLTSHESRHYFEIHEVADLKHAALWREILGRVSLDGEESALAAAIKSLEAQNKLLDAVMEKYCRQN